MRNWNYRQPVRKLPTATASRLPMRNWNQHTWPQCRSWVSASRLPMRNWNFLLPRRMRLQDCFQTTYEELKPKLWITGDVAVALPDYLWGIETSCRVRVCVPCFPASRLPMRNWNSSKPRLNVSHIALPDYLWGIETAVRCCWQIHDSASRLPMRNWNLSSACWKLWKRKASRLPMRNWNVAPHVSGNWNNASRLPMRNWNDHNTNGHRQGELASRLPMRNWNYTELLAWNRSISLPDYLWGIETGLDGRECLWNS